MSSEQAAQSFGERVHDRVADWVGRPGFWLCFVCIIASYPFYRAFTQQLPDAMPVLSRVADFELSDEFGNPYGTKQLKYKMWIAASVCTACPDQVVEMGERLFKIQHRSRGVAKRFRIVALTRDPERDTPKTLETWAKGIRYSPRMWTLLSGPQAHMDTIHKDIFQSAAVEQRLPLTRPDLETRFKVALIDTEGQVRGYFDIRDDEGLDALLLAMRMIINRGY